MAASKSFTNRRRGPSGAEVCSTTQRNLEAHRELRSFDDLDLPWPIRLRVARPGAMALPGVQLCTDAADSAGALSARELPQFPLEYRI